MLLPTCPTCRQPNAPAAAYCGACGAVLAHSALWLDELGPPADDDSTLPQPLTLRDVQVPTLAPTLAPAPAPPPAPAPAADELVVSDPEPPLLARAAASRSDARDARRASVRRSRARARAAAVAAAAADTVPEVLVFDADDAQRGLLRDLLVGFGFGVHAVAGAAQAAALLDKRRFVAAFFDVALDESDGGAGIELCHHARLADTLLVLVARPLRPMERVRAGLAGFDEVLTKPMTRGVVAGVLDARGVVLPSDARRG
jgi:CheY-like chemotaxis protein